MFNLLRYFSLAAGLAFIVVPVTLVLLYRQHEINSITFWAEAKNLTLAQSYNNTLWSRFSNYVRHTGDVDGDSLRAHPKTQEIHEAVTTLMAGMPVLKIKIYNATGLTVYSSLFSQIGADKSNNLSFLQSAREGKPASKLSFRETFQGISGAVTDRTVVESYIPIKGADGSIEGVFELYLDVSPMVTKMTRETWQVSGWLALGFGLLYGALFFIVRHADRILRRQYSTLIKNRETLSENNAALESEIAERKRAEQALQASERRLRQAQKMEAIGQLTGGVAHDFNNLLGVIIGNTEMLEDNPSSDRKQTGAILRAAIRGSELTQRLLAFARRQSLDPQSVDLNSLISKLMDMLERTLGETIQVSTKPTANLWTVNADPDQLENALINLAINARDSMPDGGRLMVETANAPLRDDYIFGHLEVAAGDYVMVAVSDTGHGIPPEHLEHVFEPFFTTKDVGEGTGLGLSMVYGFVKQSEGHIAAYSEIGQGTTIKIYLPRANAAASVEETPADDAPMAATDDETILVLEDNESMRNLVVRVIQGLGYRVLEARNGKEALSVIEDQGATIDLLLTDVVLAGGMSGPEFAREAKSRYPDLRVVFMSGYADQAAYDHVPLEPDALLIGKPFRKADLACKMRSALDRTPQRAAQAVG